MSSLWGFNDIVQHSWTVTPRPQIAQPLLLGGLKSQKIPCLPPMKLHSQKVKVMTSDSVDAKILNMLAAVYIYPPLFLFCLQHLRKQHFRHAGNRNRENKQNQRWLKRVQGVSLWVWPGPKYKRFERVQIQNTHICPNISCSVIWL